MKKMTNKADKQVFSFTVSGEEADQRLDVFLKNKTGELSREQIKKNIISGHASVDNETIDAPKYRVSENQKINFWYFKESEDLQPEDIALKVIFENSDFIVLDKPSGIVVHPGAGVKSGTIANALLFKYPELAKVGHSHRPGIVHRLDKDTSGLLLIAKNNDSLVYARELFKTRKIDKEYIALISGHIKEKKGIIEKPISLDHIRRKVVISEQGKPAKTEYEVMEYYKNLSGVDFYSLIRVVLHTGRTHQIRVHFASEGHPVAGDGTYGKGKGKPAGLKRQFLHAHRLAFRLPDGTALDLVSELPEDLQKVLHNLTKV